jgi:hypothetical protein
MKKKLVASLAAAMVLGIAGTSFAATNPFVDVPAKHWAYESVTKLAQAGIVDGYGDGTFRGDKVMSRYEMAQIVAKAMAHADRANAEQKAAIEKLATEFATELEGLNVRVTNVENKVDNVKWGGEFRERFDSVKQEGASRSTGNSHSYVDMWATAQINPDWVGKVEYESTKSMTNAGTTSTASSVAGTSTGDTQVSSTRVYVQGNLFGGQATIGKFNPFTAYGLVVDDSMTGVSLQYGNTLKARIGVGNYSGGVSSFLGNSASNFPINGLPATPGLNVPSGNGAPSYAFGELDLAASKVTNVKVVYHELGNLNGDTFITNTNSAYPFMFGNATQTSIRYIEAGFDTKLAADWALMGTYSKSNLEVAGQDNNGYLAQITYKAADTKKAGSYDIYTNYRRLPVAAQLDSTWDYAKGVKGWQLGFDYIPATNIKVNVFYLDGKNIIDENTATNAKIYRAQAELFF